jgi:hypothetical protein
MTYDLLFRPMTYDLSFPPTTFLLPDLLFPDFPSCQSLAWRVKIGSHLADQIETHCLVTEQDRLFSRAGEGPPGPCGGICMRAFRPSRFGAMEEQIHDPAEEIARIAKVESYARRAQSHQPLFDDDVQRQSEASVGKEE